MGAVSNITKEGFGPAAFHAYPSTLRIDHLSGDYGSGFFGYAVNSSTYLVKHSEFGWVSFGGNTKQSGKLITVIPTSGCRSRIYLAPLGLWLTLDAGKFESVSLNPKNGVVTIALDPATPNAKNARLRVEQPAKVAGVGTYALPSTVKSERGAYVIPLVTGAAQIILKPGK